MDRRDILVLKPNVAIRWMRGIEKCCPILGKRLLRKTFFAEKERDAITYAIDVKQRYLKLKEHECTNLPTT